MLLWDVFIDLEILVWTEFLWWIAVWQGFVWIKCKGWKFCSFSNLLLKPLLITLAYLLLELLSSLALLRFFVNVSNRRLTRHCTASDNAYLVIEVLNGAIFWLFKLSLLEVLGGLVRLWHCC